MSLVVSFLEVLLYASFGAMDVVSLDVVARMYFSCHLSQQTRRRKNIIKQSVLFQWKCIDFYGVEAWWFEIHTKFSTNISKYWSSSFHSTNSLENLSASACCVPVTFAVKSQSIWYVHKKEIALLQCHDIILVWFPLCCLCKRLLSHCQTLFWKIYRYCLCNIS